MKDGLENFVQAAKGVRLTGAERQQMRESLLRHVRNSPARSGFWQTLAAGIGAAYRPALATALVVIVLGGATAAAASNALPGDTLYGMKVNVNEEVRGLFALNYAAKAEWESYRASMRLQEAEQLSAKGQLTETARQQLEERFKAHAERVQRHIVELEERQDFSEAAEASDHLESSIRAHDSVLSGISQTSATTTMQVGPLLQTVQREGGKATAKRVQVESKIAGPEAKVDQWRAALGKMGAAQNKIAVARKMLERTKDNEQLKAEMVARLAEADRKMAEGKGQMDAKAYGEAFLLFSASHRAAQEAQLVWYAQSAVDQKEKSKSSGRVKGESLKSTGTPDQLPGQDKPGKEEGKDMKDLPAGSPSKKK